MLSFQAEFSYPLIQIHSFYVFIYIILLKNTELNTKQAFCCPELFYSNF